MTFNDVVLALAGVALLIMIAVVTWAGYEIGRLRRKVSHSRTLVQLYTVSHMDLRDRINRIRDLVTFHHPEEGEK